MKDVKFKILIIKFVAICIFSDFDSGRLAPLRNSGRRKNLVTALPQNNKLCAECSEPLISGFYSEVFFGLIFQC